MIYRLADIFNPAITTRLWNGRWALKVAARADTLRDRMRGAAAVLAGRAVAFRWPQEGEIERTLYPEEPHHGFIPIGEAANSVVEDLASDRRLGFGGF